MYFLLSVEVIEHCNSKEVCFLLKCTFLKNASSIVWSGIDFMLYYLYASPVPSSLSLSTCVGEEGGFYILLVFPPRKRETLS